MFQEMMDKLRAVRLHFTLTAILEAVLGVVLLIWPLGVVGFLATVVGVIVITMGLIVLASKIFDDVARMPGILIGLILVIVGGWIVLNPAGIVSIIPIMIGVGLVVHGVQNIMLALSARSVEAPRWGWMIFASVCVIILGVICIVCAIRVVDIAVRIGGIFMIIDGLSSIFMVHGVNKAERDVDSVIVKETDIE